MKNLDKLGRVIGVGDLIAASDPTVTGIYVGKVLRINGDVVHFRYYNTSGADPTMESLKKEPYGWECWTKNSKKRILILNKSKKHVRTV